MTLPALELHPDHTAPVRRTQRMPSVTSASGAVPCRLLNFFVALVGIMLTAPLMAVIALAIRLTSPGPVLYRQVRVGHNRRARSGEPLAMSRSSTSRHCGRLFTMYKFRTMVPDTGRKQVWALRNDPRITPLGRILRRLRLDELPQLFNVLLGDMSVVGPRPEQPAIVDKLQRQIRNYPDRQRVPPGITGLAQITLPYDASIDDVRRKVALDLEYVRRRSPSEDLRIMLRTPMVMLAGRGAN